MEFVVLGPLGVSADGRALPLGGPKQRALLALLLLCRNEPVANDVLVGRLWDGVPPRDAEAVLRIHVSKLRRTLAQQAQPRLITRARGYELRVEPGELDLDRFEQLRQAAARAFEDADPKRAAELLRSALALWRGQPLADLRDEPFVAVERARLEATRNETVVRWVEAELALGHPEAVIAELETVVAAEPYQERPRAQLMLALYRAGRQAEALAVYKQTRSLLSEELAIEPSRELRELERRILTQDPTLEPQPRHDSSPPPLARRRFVLSRAAAGAILAAAALTAVVVHFASGRPAAIAAVAANSVGVINPGTAQLVGEIRVGRDPVAISAHGRSVWVANAGDGTISQIEATGQAVVRTIGVGASPSDVAATDGTVWVSTFGLPRELIEIVPGGASSSVDVPDAGSKGRGAELAVSDGSVWLADGDSRVFRFEARSSRFSSPIEVPNGLGVAGGQVVAAAGSLWVADPHGNQLSRVDPREHAVTGTLPIGPVTGGPGGATGLAVGEGSLWAVAPDTPKLWRIDPSTGSIADVIELAHNPTAVAAGEGAVWVATTDGYVLRIDPKTSRVSAAIDVGGNPTALTTADERIWVAVA